MALIDRWAKDYLKKGLMFQRVALVVGARQSGKTTLVRDQCSISAQFATLDNDETLAAARSDPRFFIRQAPGSCLIIDEIQKAPGVIAEVKRCVDADNRPAQFVLTGSADYRKLPSAGDADTLAGRVVVVRLRTMTNAEILGKSPSFIENAFDRKFPIQMKVAPCSRKSIYELAIRGGYPQPLTWPGSARATYFKSYIDTQIQYDLQKTWDLKRYKALGKLLETFAAYSSKPLNIQELCRRISGNAITVSNYLNALEAMYLIDELPAWESKDFKLGSKTPEIFFTDSALMAFLLNINSAEELLMSHEKMSNEGGKLVETWAYTQIIPEVELHPQWRMYHFRNRNNQEIDFLIRNEKGQYLGIEIKSAESVQTDDFKHLKWFANQVEHFTGVVLYAGERILSFGGGMYAVPFSGLWADETM